MENLNWNEIVCIDLRSYNDESLAMIEEFFGIANSGFIDNKKIGINKIYFIPNGGEAIGYEVKKGFENKINGDWYKGISTTIPLSRRELKKLSEIKPLDFYKLRKELNKVAKSVENSESAPEVEVQDEVEVKTEVEEVLELDPILEKISKFGITSLTKREKDFLDNL
jgi:hypothetical protein